MNINIFLNIIGLVGTFVIVLCFCAVLASIAFDFVKFDSKDRTKQKKKSIVATGTMLLFFICFYLLIKFNIGVVETVNLYTRLIFVSVGLIIIIVGSVVNIWGRFNLGKNWANHIKIYQH